MNIQRLFLVSFLLFTFACEANANKAPVKSDTSQSDKSQAVEKSLKGGLKPFFLVGTAIENAALSVDGSADLDFIPTQFNALTAENAMKWQYIQPKEGTYNWQMADRFVDYASKHEMHITGHVLVWHQQTPKWVFKDDKGGVASKALLLQRMEKHIKHYVKRYKGKIHAWDVVNEALNDDGTYRESDWFKILGEDFIVKAFEFAHQADPHAELIYNDYNLFKPEKRAGAIRIVQLLKAKKIPVHAVGMQGHYGLGYPGDLQQIEDSIKAYAATGVKVHISELDVSVLPFPESGSEGADISLSVENRKELDPYPKGLPETVELEFNKHYLDIFKILLKHKDVVERVTFWGINDGKSWRNDWPVKGRTDYPLLITRDATIKKAALDIIGYSKTLEN